MKLQRLLLLSGQLTVEHLGVTATSGPGMALKAEAMGLAVMLEIPLVICEYSAGWSFYGTCLPKLNKAI